MQISELRQKPKTELQKMIKESREKLRQLRFDLVSGKVKNVRELHAAKKEIARISTLLNPVRGQRGVVETQTPLEVKVLEKEYKDNKPLTGQRKQTSNGVNQK